MKERKKATYTIKLENEGIYKFLKPYQVEVMRYVWNHPEGIISVEAFEYLQGLSDKKLHRSRASVIYFLDDMTQEGVLVKEWDIGKGGDFGTWRPSHDVPCEETYMIKMAMRMVKVAKEIINTRSITKYVHEPLQNHACEHDDRSKRMHPKDSIYDPIIDAFQEQEHPLVKVIREGSDAYYLQNKLNRRIKARKIRDIKVSVVNTICYIEKV